ncbi:MAG: Peroxisome biosynthesis protein pex1 [Piccolia ochrophora]|nr:MAG: Peroxisome biosynthesis protein pex1 [Piccolia ochrophora]
MAPCGARITHVPLKNCLVNLPLPLVNTLVNANTPAQDVIVQISCQIPHQSNDGQPQRDRNIIFVGWTGMPSSQPLAPVLDRAGRRGASGRKASVQADGDASFVEIDATLARMLRLAEGQRVDLSLHFDPPVAHTINIEPQTPDDWDIIELHATFLELNLLSQIRALPNPSYAPSSGKSPGPHPLTLHLSPTSSATIVVTGLDPPPPSSAAFAKISPDAEVIVAPKPRRKTSQSNVKDNRSVVSAGKKSLGARSGGSTSRPRPHGGDCPRSVQVFRGVDRGVCANWFDDEEGAHNGGLQVWLDRGVASSLPFRGAKWVCVTVPKPPSLLPPPETQQSTQPTQQGEDGAEPVKPVHKLVARLGVWEEAPDSRHAALSAALCSSLGVRYMVGGVVMVEIAPPQLPTGAIKNLTLYPFASSGNSQQGGLRFGGQSKAEKEEAIRRLKATYAPNNDQTTGILDGPLTDGMVMVLEEPTSRNADERKGGILKFDFPTSASSAEVGKGWGGWFLASDRKIQLDAHSEIPRPRRFFSSFGPGEVLESVPPTLVGIKAIIKQLISHATHLSNNLLTGGPGSGKTSLLKLLACRLRSERLWYVSYYPCRMLVTDEARVATINDTFHRLFLSASWGAQLGGHALVILDDLDLLCPAETELQVGGENGRSRQISELLHTVARKYGGSGSKVVLLTTAQDKQALHDVVVGGHVFQETVELKPPDKDGRRHVLRTLLEPTEAFVKDSGSQTKPSSEDADVDAVDNHWTDSKNDSGLSSMPSLSQEARIVDPTLDLLDVAGLTDGYMPGDLALLASRARSEAIIRTIEASAVGGQSPSVAIGKADIDRALKGFTPASLRNVSLQSSTITFNDIGGLCSTRKILLETLQYPTTYAPIFAQCPLRLRSGLLLYGFPGCGKTLLASAVAGECGLNFISVKGPEILNKYIGASEKSVRDLFERAVAARPCILFFDEFDSIAPKRGHDSTGVTDRVVNQMLTQMDGAEGLSGVYVLAATSRPDLIDPALLRPGRLDKSLLCDLPTQNDRIDILRTLSKKLKMSKEVIDQGLSFVAERTEGYSGADLQALVYNAQLEAIHDMIGDRHKIGEPERQPNKSSPIPKAPSHEFVSFRYGEEADRKEREAVEHAGTAQSKWLVERTAIAAKLETFKQAKRSRRRADHTQGRQSDRIESETQSDDVTIEWRHLRASSLSTRPSIGAEDRRRLSAIYREFVVGRNGEMPSGQGPTEVGGRSSLM